MTRDSDSDALAATQQSDSAQSSPRPATSEWPETIGKFRVEKKLGEGGMGVVLLAMDPALGRRIALKLLRAGAEANVEGRARFLREAQVMARLSHENVVIVHEVGEHEGRAYVAMEYVEGGTLTGWPAGKSWRAIVDIYLRAGRGLEAAHRAGLVHRDFKPDNVLVGSDGRVRVSDFGLAGFDLEVPVGGATTPARDAETGLTRTGALMGTPRYMAPEQHLTQPLDARADQFAFCVALYEALYGVAPFAGTTYAQIVAAVTGGRPPSPPESSPVPPAVRDAVLRGLSRDVEARFPSMSELLAVLDGALETPAPRRRWVLPVAGLGVAAVAITGGVIAFRGSPSASTPADAAVPVVIAPDAELDEGAGDDRPRIIVGDFGGDGMTEGIRVRARPSLTGILTNLAPEMRVTMVARPSDERVAKLGRAYWINIELSELQMTTDNNMQCRIKALLGTYPDKSILSFADTGARVTLQSRALKDLDAAAVECVDAAVESNMMKTLLPFLRKRLNPGSGN